MSTLAVVEKILRETGAPMSVREIVDAAGETLPTKSKTPDTVVARDLSMDIKKKGEASIFIRTSPGRYTMRALWLAKQATSSSPESTSTDAPTHTSVHDAAAPQLADGAEGSAATEVLAKAIRHERQATLAAKRATRGNGVEHSQG